MSGHERKYFVVERKSKVPSDVVVYPVTKVLAYNEGYVMEYFGGEKVKDVVYVPKWYGFLRRNGAGWVGKVSGNNSAAPVRFGFAVGGSVDPDCPGEDLSMLVRTDLMARGYRTVYERKAWWKVALVIGGVVVAGVVLIMVVRGGFGV